MPGPSDNDRLTNREVSGCTFRSTGRVCPLVWHFVAALAQSVECKTLNLAIAGSSPAGGGTEPHGSRAPSAEAKCLVADYIGGSRSACPRSEIVTFPARSPHTTVSLTIRTAGCDPSNTRSIASSESLFRADFLLFSDQLTIVRSDSHRDSCRTLFCA